MLDKKIENFYLELRLPVNAIIDKLRVEGISKPAIQAALEAYWKQVSKSKFSLARTSIVNHIRKTAKLIEASEKKEFYTRKYHAERKELTVLRAKKYRFDNIKRANIHDLALVHGPYWVVIVSILSLVYFLGT